MPQPAAPLDDIDPVAIERTINGHRPTRLTPAETAEAVRILAAAGHSDPHIAERLHCSDRTIQRIRHRHRIPPGIPPHPGTLAHHHTRTGAA